MDRSVRDGPMSLPATVCIVVGSLEPGGTEWHLARVLPRLDQNRFVTEVFTLTGGGHCADVLEAAGVRVHLPRSNLWEKLRHPFLRAVLLAWRAVCLLYHFTIRRPDAVHFFLPAAYLVGAPLAILAGIRPRLMSRRSLNLYQTTKPGAVGAIERALHRRMDLILGNSEAVVRQLVEQEGVPVNRCRLLYNGVEAPHVGQDDRARLRESLGFDDQTVVLSIVANLIPYKGHADLLEACGLLTTVESWALLIIGNDSGGIGKTLRGQAQALGVAERVCFLGGRSDIEELMAASDVGLLTSHEEGFSNAILESMAAGLPMVVTDVGGNAEAVVDGETGILVPARDSSALAAGMARLVDDQALRLKMGKAAQRRVNERFSLEGSVKNYEAVYTSVLTGKERAA